MSRSAGVWPPGFMTRSGVRRALCVAAVVVALAGAAGCGDDDDSSSGTTESTESGTTGSSVVESAQQLCDSLESLDSTVQDIGGDPETTTIADVKDGLAQLKSDVSDVAGSGSALAGALGTALQSAFDRFESTVENLPRTRPCRPRATPPGRRPTTSSSRGTRLCRPSTASVPGPERHQEFHPNGAM